MICILGVDPGSRVTGYGLIRTAGSRLEHVANGCIRTPAGELAARLHAIFEGLSVVIDQFRPDEMAVEKVFVKRNIDSALKLGQARGAAIVAGASRGLPVHEFTPAQIKQAIVGRGGADKVQVQHMIKMLLRLDDEAQSDAADALAVAVCHAHTREGLRRMQAASGAWGRRSA